MNNVGIVAVKDYLSNVANATEIAELEQLIANRKRELRTRATADSTKSDEGDVLDKPASFAPFHSRAL